MGVGTYLVIQIFKCVTLSSDKKMDIVQVFIKEEVGMEESGNGTPPLRLGKRKNAHLAQLQ